MERKYACLLTIIAILVALLAWHATEIDRLQKQIAIDGGFLNLVIHLFSVRHFEATGTPIEFSDLIDGNEERFCQVFDGAWSEEEFACHGISWEQCIVINGSHDSTVNNRCLLE